MFDTSLKGTESEIEEINQNQKEAWWFMCEKQEPLMLYNKGSNT